MNALTRWGLALATVVLAMVGAGLWFYQSQQQEMRQDTEANLQVITQLKADQIARWRQERLADAAQWMASPFLKAAIEKWLATPDPATTEALITTFRGQHESYADIQLVDANGQVRLSLSGHPRMLPAAETELLAAAARNPRPQLSDLHLQPGDSSPCLDVIAPLTVTHNGAVQNLGAIILKCQAQQFLFPLIQAWPGRSASGETLLVRREGESVLYLNDLRFQAGTALQLRFPLFQTNLPAARAVRGETGICYGTDYRGVPVVSALRAVPDSPWFIVAKEDVAEAFAAWRFRAELILTLLFTCVLAAVVIGSLIWHWKTREFRYNRSLIEVSLDPLVTIGAGGKILDVNAATEAATGRPRTELIGTDFSDYFTEPDLARAGYQQVFRDGQVRDYPLELRHRDGQVISVLYNAAVYRDAAGKVAGVFAAARDVTVQKWTQAALALREAEWAALTLRESEEKYRSLFANSQAAILTLAPPDWKFTSGNRSALTLFGAKSEAELLAHGPGDLSPACQPDGHASAGQVRERIATALREGSVFFEWTHRRLDGQEFGAEVLLTRLERWGKISLQATVLDITARQRAEAELGRMRNLLAEGQKIAHLGSWEYLAATQDTIWSEEQLRIYGLDPAGPAPDYQAMLRHHIHPDDAARLDETFRQCLQDRAVFDQEHRLVRPDGSVRVVQELAHPYFDDHGKLVKYVGTTLDITERKQAEAELAETKALLQAALDHSQAGIAIADAPSGRLRYVNQAGLLIGGGTEAELVAGLDINQYVASWNLFNLDGTPLAKEAVPLTRAVLFGEHCTREFIIRRSEHDDRTVLANAAPIRNPAGAVTAGIVVFLDITEHKRAEELLRQNTEELRARNEELTRFNRLMAGRELRNVELKQQVNDLAAHLGQARPYPLAFLNAAAAEVVRTTPKPGEQNSKILESPKGTSP